MSGQAGMAKTLGVHGKTRVVAPPIGEGGRAAATGSELQFALPLVATRNGLAPPSLIGAPRAVHPQAAR